MKGAERRKRGGERSAEAGEGGELAVLVGGRGRSLREAASKRMATTPSCTYALSLTARHRVAVPSGRGQGYRVIRLYLRSVLKLLSALSEPCLDSVVVAAIDSVEANAGFNRTYLYPDKSVDIAP